MPPKKAKKVNGYQRPADISLGTVLTDLQKNSWKVGPSIGSGGFGDIYACCSATSPTKKKIDDYPHVVKIEPHGNGPLFVEMHFYTRNCKKDDIQKYRVEKGWNHLGMPNLVSHGSQEIHGERHRFLVLPRFGTDIWKLFLKNNRRIPQHTVYRLALQLINVLEYMHSKGYVHADIKGANILLGVGKSGDEHCYLVDFGLATHYTTKEYKPDPKNAHNGTIEYTSRDAHNGVATMRGDMEILGLNLVHWLGLDLPWESQNLLANPKKVQESKEQYMKNLDKQLSGAPEAIKAFMKYVERMRHDERPDYEKCKGFMEKGLKACGGNNKGPLQFEEIASTGRAVATPKKRVREASPTPAAVSSPRRKTPVAATAAPSKRAVTSPKKVPAAKTPPRSKRDSSIIVIDSPTPTPNTDDIKKRASDRRAGHLTVNNDITPKTSAAGAKKAKKTYEFNFELDVSLDADVVVNVKRKRKAANGGTPQTASKTPLARNKALSQESGTSGSPISPVVRKRIARNVKVTPQGSVRVEKG